MLTIFTDNQHFSSSRKLNSMKQITLNGFFKQLNMYIQLLTKNSLIIATLTITQSYQQ